MLINIMENKVLELVKDINIDNVESRNLFMQELTNLFGFEFKEVDTMNNILTYHGFNPTTEKKIVITVSENNHY